MILNYAFKTMKNFVLLQHERDHYLIYLKNT